MDREHFIISVYCLVCEHHQALTQRCRLRRAGFAPALTDEEVITIEICGEAWKMNTDQDIFTYFRAHWLHFFPALTDRTLFVRQAANLAPAKAALQQRLVQISGQADDPVQVVDTLPLPVCVRTRARRDRCFKPLADYGHCAAKKLDYYGFKLGLRLSRCGMITAFSLLPARPHDVHLLGDLVDGFSGTVAADRGFIDAFRHTLLWQRYGIQMVTPVRKNMAPSPLPRPLLRVCARSCGCALAGASGSRRSAPT